MEARWVALAGGVVIESIAGSPYAFGVWEPALKAQLNYTQAEIETVGSVGNFGQYTAFFAGLAYDAFGPRVTGIVGALLSVIGYGMLWSVSSLRTPHPVSVTSAWAFLAYMGSSWFDTLAICAAAHNFSAEKGLALGLTKSLYGLSASLLTTAYENLFEPDVTRYLGFLAILVPVVGAGFAMLVTRVQDTTLLRPLTRAETAKFAGGYVGVLAIAGYVAAVGILHSTGAVGMDPALAYVLVPLVLLQLLLAVPLPGGGARRAAELEAAAAAAAAAGGGGRLSVAGSLQDSFFDAGGSVAGGTAVAGPGAPPSRAPASGATLVGAMLSLDYWLVFVALIIGTGAGLSVINNVGSLAQSLLCAGPGQCHAKGCGQATGDLLVTLTSIANCTGRMVGGVASDGLKARLHRPGFFALDLALMALAQLVLLVAAPGNPAAMYCGVLLSGFAYGAFWSLVPAFMNDRFGGRAFGSINALSSLSTAFGSYAFSVGLAATLYQAHIPEGCGTVCTGVECYRTTFGILAALCGGVALPLALWVALRTRHVYGGPGGAPLPFEEAEALAPEALWKVRARRRCLAGCVCCGAWGRGLVVAPEEQRGFGGRAGGGVGGPPASVGAGSSWDEDGLQGLLGRNGVALDY